MRDVNPTGGASRVSIAALPPAPHPRNHRWRFARLNCRPPPGTPPPDFSEKMTPTSPTTSPQTPRQVSRPNRSGPCSIGRGFQQPCAVDGQSVGDSARRATARPRRSPGPFAGHPRSAQTHGPAGHPSGRRRAVGRGCTSPRPADMGSEARPAGRGGPRPCALRRRHRAAGAALPLRAAPRSSALAVPASGRARLRKLPALRPSARRPGPTQRPPALLPLPVSPRHLTPPRPPPPPVLRTFASPIGVLGLRFLVQKMPLCRT